MSDPVVGDDDREEADQRPDSGGGNGAGRSQRDALDGAGAKRDSDASSGSEGSQQQRQTQQAQQGQAPGQGGNKTQGQGQLVDESDGSPINSIQDKRHVEASPQGRYLRFNDKLGTGQYKVVYRSYDTSMGIEVAWNTVNIKNLPKEEKKRIMNEVRLLQNLEHKNLVQFHGSWVNREREEVIFVTEIMQSGSLMNFIRKVEMIRWRVVKRWARQILRGMDYLHSQDPPIIHRDLKCDNIFINGAAGDIRIGDLGLSTSDSRSEKTMSVLGTPEFMAPELYEESYTEKVDIYAFGMCMLEMVTKERPYSECVNAAQIYRKVTSQILPSALERVQNVRAREFIRGCLSPNPDQRPSAMELLDFPFLKDKNEDEDNTLVMLDPLVAEGTGQTLDTGAISAGTGVNVPAKIDPTLPGVSHPAQRGAPALDTIEEATPNHGVQGMGTPKTSANALQGSLHNVGASGGSHGDSVVSTSSASDGSGDAPTRRPPHLSDVVSSDVGEGKNEVFQGGDGGYAEQVGEVSRSGDHAPSQLGAAVRGEGGDAQMVEVEEMQQQQQSGGHRIPGNPPFDSDGSDEEEGNDASHSESFLRAMPEDERGIRSFKLPDGRVRRGEDYEDEAGDRDDGVDTPLPAYPAPPSGQARPSPKPGPPALSTPGAPGPSPATETLSVAAPLSQAPLPPTAGDSKPSQSYGGRPPSSQAPRPPAAEPKGSDSAGRRRKSVASTADATGSLTPRTASPSNAITSDSPRPKFSSTRGTSDTSPALKMPSLWSDPGFVSPQVGPPMRVERSRSFSPSEPTPDAVQAVHLPRTASGTSVDAADGKAYGVVTPDGAGTSNGPRPGTGLEAERNPAGAQRGDHELRQLLSRRASVPGKKQTEIKIANLQGPEQEIMRLVMHALIEGRLQEVEFDFNLDQDHPGQVSAEMIRELGLSDEELGQISLTITNLAEKARKRRIRRTSSAGSATAGLPGGPSSLTPALDTTSNPALPWAGIEQNIGPSLHRGSQGSGGTPSFGSGGGDGVTPGDLEPADIDQSQGRGGGSEDPWSDDDPDSEEDDEFQKTKLMHDKKRRQAEKVYETRLAALLTARNDRTDEHKRAQERYKKDCDDFDKKVEKLRSEKERRREECLEELRELEDKYRQSRNAKHQAKRHSAAAGNMAAQTGVLLVGQGPLEAAPTPQGYLQRHSIGQGQQSYTESSTDDIGVSDQHPMSFSQFNSTDGHLGVSQWSNTSQDVSAVVAAQQQAVGSTALTAEEEDLARRERLSTL